MLGAFLCVYGWCFKVQLIFCSHLCQSACVRREMRARPCRIEKRNLLMLKSCCFLRRFWMFLMLLYWFPVTGGCMSSYFTLITQLTRKQLIAYCFCNLRCLVWVWVDHVWAKVCDSTPLNLQRVSFVCHPWFLSFIWVRLSKLWVKIYGA